MENGELSQKRKDVLAVQCGPLQPGATSVECQQGYLALALTARSGEPCSDTGAGLATLTFSK
jgi:hypothetical protein